MEMGVRLNEAQFAQRRDRQEDGNGLYQDNPLKFHFID